LGQLVARQSTELVRDELVHEFRVRFLTESAGDDNAIPNRPVGIAIPVEFLLQGDVSSAAALFSQLRQELRFPRGNI
jgi:hypothetical protein